MLLLPLAFAFSLPPAPASAEPLPLKTVMKELRVGILGGNDGCPGWKPTEGTAYLVVCEERCHDAFLELLDGIDSGKYDRHKDVHITELFAALRKQKCDRSRFLPYAQRYALENRESNKVSEYTQRHAVELLGQIGSDKHVEGLLKVMSDLDRPLRMAALKAITNLGDARHVPALKELYDNPVPDRNFQFAEEDRKLISEAADVLRKKPAPGPALKAKPGDGK